MNREPIKNTSSQDDPEIHRYQILSLNLTRSESRSVKVETWSYFKKQHGDTQSLKLPG